MVMYCSKARGFIVVQSRQQFLPAGIINRGDAHVYVAFLRYLAIDIFHTKLLVGYLH